MEAGGNVDAEHVSTPSVGQGLTQVPRPGSGVFDLRDQRDVVPPGQPRNELLHRIGLAFQARCTWRM